MKRRVFLALAAAGIACDAERGRPEMATEVKHGPNPVFDAPLTGATFKCEVVGRYTKVPGLGAGGVTAYRFMSDNPGKRRAELLVLRTAFLEWFREMYEANGGSRIEAAGQVRYIADGWLR
jgi:hypothetical protein